MFHMPLADDDHGVSLFVLVPSCVGGGLLIIFVAIVTMVIIRRRSRYKAKRLLINDHMSL